MKNSFGIRIRDIIFIFLLTGLLFLAGKWGRPGPGLYHFLAETIGEGRFYPSVYYGGLYLSLGRLVLILFGTSAGVGIQIVHYMFTAGTLAAAGLTLQALGFRRWSILLTIITLALHFKFLRLADVPNPIMAQLFFHLLIYYTAISGILTGESIYFRWNAFLWALSALNSLAFLLLLPSQVFLLSKMRTRRQRWVWTALTAVFFSVICLTEILLTLFQRDFSLEEIRFLAFSYSPLAALPNVARLLIDLAYGYPFLGLSLVLAGVWYAFRRYRPVTVYLLLTLASLLCLGAVTYYGQETVDVLFHFTAGLFIAFPLNLLAKLWYRTYERWFITASLSVFLLVFLPLFTYSTAPVLFQSYRIRPTLYQYPLDGIPSIREMDPQESARWYFQPWAKLPRFTGELRAEIGMIPERGVLVADPELYFTFYDFDNRVRFINPAGVIEFMRTTLESGKRVFIPFLEEYYYRKTEILREFRIVPRGKLFEVVLKKGKDR